MNNNECRIFTSALYLNLWLVKVLRLHQHCYAVIEGVQIVGPSMILPISNFTSTAFLLVEEMEVLQGDHRGVIRKLRKTAIIADLTHYH